MAGAAPQWTKRLAIQLVRGLPGTRIVHRGTVRALGLRRRHQTVFRDNSPSICGMINQVKRLLSVETEEMYNARLEAEAKRKALRPPLVIRHSPRQSKASTDGFLQRMSFTTCSFRFESDSADMNLQFRSTQWSDQPI